jgi:hypothetical protein
MYEYKNMDWGGGMLTKKFKGKLKNNEKENH